MALNQNAPTVFPTLAYHDAEAAIDFLTGALGLLPGEIARDGDGRIVHALLGWGNGVVMVSSRRGADSPFDTEHCCVYLAVSDPDAAHDRAVDAGAEVVMGLTDQDYGSREFAVRDQEGNVWCLGTYQPASVPPPVPTRTV